MPNNSSVNLEFELLEGDGALILFMRIMEAINYLVYGSTLYIIHKHSARSLGAYRYCLIQIVSTSFISQQCTLLGPIFTMPIIGAYHYIDFTDNPAVVHGILCFWILMCAFDIQGILDGFNFRLRVLLLTFHPRLAGRTFWVSLGLGSKLCALIYVLIWLAPIGQYLHREDMRHSLEYVPKLLPTFDKYKSFVVYDLDKLPGFWTAMMILAGATVYLMIYGIGVISAIFRVLKNSSNSMSVATQKIHARFVIQLSLQASVPFVVLVCPLTALLGLTLVKFPYQNNFPGYAIIVMLLAHSPLTSCMTIALYEPYRKAIKNIFSKSSQKRNKLSTRVSFTNIASGFHRSSSRVVSHSLTQSVLQEKEWQGDNGMTRVG